MPASISNLVSGPAKFFVDDVFLAHTFGGIQAKISPKNRAQKVDQYGEGMLNIVHQGDDVRMTVPFVEWSAAVLGQIYNPGATNLSSGTGAFIGIGRSAGLIYTDYATEIVPIATADALKKVEMWRAVPIGEFTVAFDNEKDRLFSVEYAGLVDETQGDGQLIGRIYLN